MEHSSEIKPSVTEAVERKVSRESESELSKSEKVVVSDPEVQAHEEPEDGEKGPSFYQRFRPFILGAIALVILGWWISSTILHKTRHRWCVPR